MGPGSGLDRSVGASHGMFLGYRVREGRVPQNRSGCAGKKELFGIQVKAQTKPQYVCGCSRRGSFSLGWSLKESCTIFLHLSRVGGWEVMGSDLAYPQPTYPHSSGFHPFSLPEHQHKHCSDGRGRCSSSAAPVARRKSPSPMRHASIEVST